MSKRRILASTMLGGASYSFYKYKKRYFDLDTAIQKNVKLISPEKDLLETGRKLFAKLYDFTGIEVDLVSPISNLASEEFTQRINNMACEMGIKNKITVYTHPDTTGSMCGVDHHLNDTNVFFKDENPNNFIIYHELSHIKYNHYTAVVNWTGVTPPAIKYTKDLFYMTVPLLAFPGVFRLVPLAACGLMKYVGLRNAKRFEEEADRNALQYCDSSDIREIVDHFREDQRKYQRMSRSKIFTFNSRGDFRYLMDRHPYASTRINYMKETVTDLPPLEVSVTYVDGAKNEFYLNESENKEIRKLIEDSWFNVDLFSVNKIDIDLREKRLPVSTRLTKQSRRLPMFNINETYDRTNTPRDKVDPSLVQNFLHTEREEGVIICEIETNNNTDLENIIKRVESIGVQHIRTIRVDERTFRFVFQEKPKIFVILDTFLSALKKAYSIL